MLFFSRIILSSGPSQGPERPTGVFIGFRLLVLVCLAWAGAQYTPFPGQPVYGALIGLAGGAAIIGLELRLYKVPAHSMVGALVAASPASSARTSSGASWPACSSSRSTSSTPS
ncbi:MAG: hypothetical protein U0599_00350 [Vicinamibacteria bacterium]